MAKTIIVEYFHQDFDRKRRHQLLLSDEQYDTLMERFTPENKERLDHLFGDPGICKMVETDDMQISKCNYCPLNIFEEEPHYPIDDPCCELFSDWWVNSEEVHETEFRSHIDYDECFADITVFNTFRKALLEAESVPLGSELERALSEALREYDRGLLLPEQVSLQVLELVIPGKEWREVCDRIKKHTGQNVFRAACGTTAILIE